MTYDAPGEASRIRDAYRRRDESGKARLYSWSRPDTLFIQYRLQAAVARSLAALGWNDLGAKECLDIGCGTGTWLRTLAEWGANPSRLHGIELLADRVKRAKELSPGVDFRLTDGWPIPFETGSMDLVTANTVFSSILAPAAREALAKEIRRVLRARGVILAYDFRISDPRNRDTIGIGPREIRRLFPEMIVSSMRLTLAPPILRRLIRFSPLLAHAMEAALPFLRTHSLYVVREPGPERT